MEFGTGQFWLALLQIIGVNIVLSGDNAVVIALAARSLPPLQQRRAVMWGSGAAVAMRIVLTVVAVELLRLPYLKLVGALLLLWIGIQLLLPEDEDGGTGSGATASMASAIRTILLADLVMSLDNVIAVAAAAKGNMLLLVTGLLVSIPLVIFGSTYLMKLMERWPIIVTIGAGLLGWVAGEMAVTDPAVHDYVESSASFLHLVLPIVGAAAVVSIGKWLATRAEAREAARPVVDLAVPAGAHAHLAAATTEPRLRLLLVADDSATSNRAVESFVRQLRWYREPPEVHLLNTQHPVHGDVSTFVAESQIKDYHQERGLNELAEARALLDRAGIGYQVHIGVGMPSQVVAHYAKEKQCEQILMSEHSGSAVDGLLGSVATEVVRMSDVPVMLV